jgi:hypothetical protein
MVIVGLLGCDSKDNKRDVFLKCQGKIVDLIIYNKIDASSSFYVGKDFVEQEGVKYLICEESKTKIKYSDDCKKTQLTKGDIDLVAKTVYVDNSLKKLLPNIGNYQCEIVKNPRY